MNAASETTCERLVPFALKDAPALIEAVFPAQKISFEAQKERKANLGQTLTGLGSYWKGRKPLILVRAIVLGSLLPQTGNAETDLDVFEMLLALDEVGLARRALANDGLKPKEIAGRITLNEPWQYFSHNVKPSAAEFEEVDSWTFPMDSDQRGISIRWKKDIDEEDKVELYRQALATFSSYEEKAALCKRPEEVDQDWLYGPIWSHINLAYEHLGIEARSVSMLVEQLGILRYGRRPRVGDTFCGGGSIPFEAARLGCEVYAADLNPIACMLTWGALNIVGASPERRAKIQRDQLQVAELVDREIAALRIEHDEEGNRAKSYLYCVEARCPETGWLVPMSPSWVISKTRGVIVRLKPDHANKRFEMDVVAGASAEEMKVAEQGTIRDGALTYELNGKTYRTPIKTLRGDYRDPEGNTRNRLRPWGKLDFRPLPNDIFQERLYAIHWINRDSLESSRQETFFRSVTESDLKREREVEERVAASIARWQEEGLIPDMVIERGDETTRLIRERGWTYWHHLFNARQLLFLEALRRASLNAREAAAMTLFFTKVIDWCNKGCHWHTGWDKPENLFYNQAFDTFWNFGTRSGYFLLSQWGMGTARYCDLTHLPAEIRTAEAKDVRACDMFVSDPPYADAVVYHEITEFFIAWLRKSPPPPFDEWVWDSRRALAIKGSGDDFRQAMVGAYREMSEHMPDHGMQCVMFTHQDTSVWADMVGIFWAAGLQVVAAWYIATETTSELKKGGYVQGTVILMLKKRSPGERAGFKQRILPAVRAEVERQIQSMMHLNSEVRDKHGEPVFNDSDLQMGGYAAALKVLTAYTHIGGEDVTTFALRPRQKGEVTVVDEIVQQAAEAANSLLVPEDLNAETWAKLNGIQRFYLRMMDMETTGASKLDNYQNFAKAFRVQDYVRVMGNITANKARLKRITEFASRDLADSTEIGGTVLGNLIIGMQQLLNEVEPQTVISQLQAEMPDFIEVRPLMIDILSFIERKSPEQNVRSAAEVFGARLRNLRAIGQ